MEILQESVVTRNSLRMTLICDSGFFVVVIILSIHLPVLLGPQYYKVVEITHALPIP